MKKIFTLIIVLSSILVAANTNSKDEDIAKQHLKIAMEKEKKYAIEQTFYQADSYDLKGSEVNKESVKKVKELEVDDLDMDSVYD